VSPAPNQRGFTLIELLVVISVIAILAALVTPLVFRNVGDAKLAAAKAQLGIFELALDAYRLDNDYYPTTSQGLNALVAKPQGAPAPLNWRGPYLRRSVPLDPWGRVYLYHSPSGGSSDADSYEVSTLGRDGAVGGAGEDADIALTHGAVVAR
jgi:general secretion pathway protein G